jgi:hypothetical protein
MEQEISLYISYMEKDAVHDFLLRECEDGGELMAEVSAKCPVEYRRTFTPETPLYRMHDLEQVISPDIYRELKDSVKTQKISIWE